MNARYLLLAIFSLFIVSGTLAYAQLGEQAGQPFFNISVGSSSTFNYSILNSGSAPIGYSVVLPTLNTIPNNATPTVAVTPMNGTLAPDSQQVISIRASIPSSDKPYLKWQGVLSIVETAPVANVTGGAGAIIREGVAKIVTIESAPPKGVPLIYYVIVVFAIVIVAVAATYAMIARKKSRMAAKKRANAAKIKAKLKKRAPARTRKAVRKKPAKGTKTRRNKKSTKKRTTSASRKRARR